MHNPSKVLKLEQSLAGHRVEVRWRWLDRGTVIEAVTAERQAGRQGQLLQGPRGQREAGGFCSKLKRKPLKGFQQRSNRE